MVIKINFICIGAQKAGTTWLFEQFDKSNQIEMLPLKELHYFDRTRKYPSRNDKAETKLSKRLTNPIWTYRAIKSIYKEKDHRKWFVKWFFSDYTDKWYLSLFDDVSKVTGEITPAYAILDEEDVKNMSKLLGKDTKIIYLLRHPVERSWSSFIYKYRFNEELLSDNYLAEQYFKSEEHLLRSNYIRTIDLYKKYFKSVFIGFFDAIVDNSINLLIDVFNYLKLDIKELNNFNSSSNKVNSSKAIPIPNSIKLLLENMHKNQIFQLSNSYGGYFYKWQNQNDFNHNLKYKSSIILKS